MSLRDIYRIIFRHKRKVLAVFASIMASVVALAWLTPREYRSETELFVRLGRENATLDPTATLGQGSTVALPNSRESEINSVVEVLQSRLLVEQVVDALGPEEVLGESEDSAGGTWLAALGSSDDPAGGGDAFRERAIRRMTAKLQVEAVRRSNIVRVTYDGFSPESSQAVVSKLTDAFLDQHVRLNRTHGAKEFLDVQAQQLHRELSGKEERLRDLKSRIGFADVPIQRKLLVDRIGRLEDDLLQATVALRTSQAQVRALEQKLGELPAEKVTSEVRGRGDEGTSGMRQQYYALRLKEQELASMYTDSHPKLVEVREQVKAAEVILAREPATRVETTTGPAKPHEETTLALLREQPLLSSLEAKTKAVETQLADVRGQLRLLNENDLQVAQLQREVELHEANYRKYSAAVEQARIDEALGSERISNINVSQPATLESKPVRPRRLLYLALGLAVAALASLALAFAAESLDHTIKTPEDLEKRLEMPILVTVPRWSGRRYAVAGRN